MGGDYRFSSPRARYRSPWFQELRQLRGNALSSGFVEVAGVSNFPEEGKFESGRPRPFPGEGMKVRVCPWA